MTNIRKDQCIECGSSHLQKIDDTRTVCLNCGIIQNSELATPLVNDSKKNHVVQKTDSWLGHVRIRDSTEKRYAYALQEINRVCESQKLPGEICIKSAELLIGLARKRTLKKHPISALCVASIYAVCRQNGKPCDLQQLSEYVGQTTKKIRREYFFIRKTMNLKSQKPNYVELLGIIKLNVSQQLSENILKAYVETTKTHGRNPRSLVAAASYTAAQFTGEPLTQRKASNALNVTERALRSNYKDMTRVLSFTVKL